MCIGSVTILSFRNNVLKKRPANYCCTCTIRGLPLIMYAPRGRGGGSSLPYISIAYNMQKGGEGVQKVCKLMYVLNERPPTKD